MAITEIIAIVQRIRTSLGLGKDFPSLFFKNATRVVEIEIKLIRLRKTIEYVLLIYYPQLSQ